ncbi:MAG: phosphoribosylformylglycinamidine cyclo-ligase [Wenzhouxiangellaceae bacterium]|nr:phosphoribosylformylglycinamidine cyclo-ligase [Wenzhouxiangellaceae bacterium]MBS3746675.1 phosphoribosylformylglycinamidine cyclo-ligase [Wenzhouxiangellaceae bacterium]MBS3822693.1 phosphoribosylformylglycinamidine cyclo-ligase [Wenzhouxiangellaceae bacterium]
MTHQTDDDFHDERHDKRDDQRDGNRDNGLSYKRAGVDIDAGNRLVERIKPAVRRTGRPEVLGGLGGFGGLYHLGSRFEDPVLVSGTDGVGTKLMLARELDHHRDIGVDLVAMCVNDILVCGAEPLFFLDYYACGKLEVDAAAEVIEGIAAGCEQAGCALIGGETAEMPGMYPPGDYDLAGFAVGAIERQRIIDGTRVDDGCALVGLHSSGPHSNGYSLIRKVLERAGGCERNAGRARALMAPTRIYVADVLPLLDDFDIRGMAHITGGGLDENIVRVLPDEFGVEIDTTAWQPPEVFAWLAEVGGIEPAEMRRTFNLGIGFVLFVPDDQVDSITNALTDRNGTSPAVIGHVHRLEAGQARVKYTGE